MKWVTSPTLLDGRVNQPDELKKCWFRDSDHCERVLEREIVGMADRSCFGFVIDFKVGLNFVDFGGPGGRESPVKRQTPLPEDSPLCLCVVLCPEHRACTGSESRFLKYIMTGQTLRGLKLIIAVGPKNTKCPRTGFRIGLRS